VKTTCYIQVEPVWAYRDKNRLNGANVKRVTRKRPDSPIPGSVVVKLSLDIADAAFMPLQPEATVSIAVEHTEAVHVQSEPLELVA